MCGIVGYIGNKECSDILIKGLERLEYRGYDSAGLALLDKQCTIIKSVGKVNALKDKVNGHNSYIGIGHTRWATHGAPSERNAHPHISNNSRITLVHNGIIENYETLRSLLQKEGFSFYSDTDTEILVNFIQYISEQHKCKINDAIRIALQQVVGAYAIAVIDDREPDRIILAKRSSPLAIGVGNSEYIIASDATPIVEYTKNVIYLEDDTVVTLTRTNIEITDLNANLQEAQVTQVELDIDEIEKGGFDTFMLKEISEQPRAIRNCFRGRIKSDQGIINMSGVEEIKNDLLNANRIIILSCGTSWHAGLIGEYIIEELARIPVEVEYASEFRYRNPIIGANDIVIAISQSGETADTLAAIKIAKERGRSPRS
jgi:glucosamine--fructose-6-phosphate aminotransferase (isomerizing)